MDKIRTVSPLTFRLLYLRTGTGACPYDCDYFSRLVSLAEHGASPFCVFVPFVAKLPSCIFGQAQGPVPTIAIASYLSRLPSRLLYLRTGTGACPYDCDCFSRLSPFAFRLLYLSSAV